MKTIIATIVAAALFYLSQGLDQMWVLAWLAPAPVLWLAYSEERAWRVVLASLVAFAAGMAFLMQCYLPVFPVPLVAGLTVTLLPSLILFPVAVLFARWVERRLPAMIALFAFPLAWSAIEFLVSLISPHGIYLSFANSQIGAPLTEQPASLLGMFAITFLICLFGNALALGAHRRAGGFIAAGVGLAICAVAIAFSAVRIQQPQGAPVRIAALADNDTTDPQFGVAPGFGHGGLEAAGNAFAPVIRDAAAKGAKLIVLPEGGLFAHPSWQRAVLSPVGKAAAQTHMLVVAGLVVFTTKDDHASHAADLAIAYPPGRTPITYVKRHLLHGLEDNFVPGHTSGFIGDGVAMAICKDMDFPRTFRDDALKGDIRLMAVPASDLKLDGWMHGRLATLRGVENGFAVVRPANEGMILVSDAYGRIVAQASTTHPGMVSVITDVPMGPGRTLYTRIGDVFPWLCVTLSLLIAAMGTFVGKRRAA